MTDRIADIFFSAYWKFKWNGDDLKRRAHAMAVFERLSLDEQRRIQLDRLRALVDHARKEVPHCAATFAQAGIASGADLKTLDDLALLPVTRRSDVQAHGASMAARQGLPGARRARTRRAAPRGHPSRSCRTTSTMESRARDGTQGQGVVGQSNRGTRPRRSGARIATFPR
ncbi:MAG: phenylacetate--CoA ligase [Acidobacteria bacterium]|nr:phenylacetate--CoA ligase [Acidobacteriota bacterium]